ncbi:MAG TPA: acyl-CoA dehydrogenase family protein [Myxococcales bacterium]|nr:acyl-CoA dehydrogenase family protein [Myxococcales bacterium]
MASSNFFLDNDDLRFQVKHGVEWEALARLAESDFTLPDGPRSAEEAVAFYTDVISAAGEVAAKEIAPRAPAIDSGHGARFENGDVKLGPELQKAKEAVTAVGLYGVSAPRELGGSNCPAAVYFILNELLGRADPGALSDFSFHAGVTLAMRAYSAREGTARVENGRVVQTRWDDAIRKICAGEESGCMVMTEPGAGSDLAAIRTRAVPRGGKWYLDGEKIFITNGHSQHHFVLARSEEEHGSDGLKALSLFWVPRWLERDGKRVENVKVTKVEEKMGHHGSPTCSLLYEQSEGELVGRRGQGFELMLFLMNSARLAVGLEAIGNAEAAYRAALGYASERRAMGKPICQHELIAERLMDMETWLAALRAMAFDAINAAELSQALAIKLQYAPPSEPLKLAELTAQQARASRKARRLTPLVKYAAAEKGVEIARDAMQIHGGMGYINETGVHRYLRDALVMPIYEGTSQIQALMATKDHLMAAVRNPAGFLRRSTRARVMARTADGELARMVARAEVALASATEKLLLRIFGTKLRAEWERGVKGKDARAAGQYLKEEFLRHWDARADFSHGLLHAERMTKLLADVAMGKVLLKQAERFPERRALAERFIRRMVLRTEAVSREIAESDDAVFERIASEQARAKSA